MKISKKSQYGLRAMAYLADGYKQKKMPSIKKISEAEGIPFDFLEKIVMELEKAGLVKGKKGAGGGYVLSKSPKAISAFDVVSVLEKTTTPVDCSFCGRSKRCMTKSVWKKIEKSMNNTLKSITLSDLTI